MIYTIAVYYAFLIYAIGVWTPPSLQIQLLSLDKLPIELILSILQHVSFRDKLSLSLVSKYLNHVANVSIYQTIYITDKGFHCLNGRLACCYRLERLNPAYFQYVEHLHTNGYIIDHKQVPYSLIYHHQDLLINLRNPYVTSKLTFLEIDQNYKLPILNNLKILKLHKDVDVSCCGLSDESLSHLEELIIVDDPMVLKRFNAPLTNIKTFEISINVDRLNYEEFWDCLESKISINALQVFKLSFDSSLNLSKNPYLISIESLHYLDEINEFLHKFAVSTSTNIREISIVVKDQRHGTNNFFKKIQPDLNRFLSLLPNSLDKVVVKLSNEFNLGQFHNFLRNHMELKEFTFVGNLNSDFLDGRDLKLNMLNGGCVIKDYTLYGKFNRVSNSDVDLIREFADLSKRCNCDFLRDDIFVNEISSSRVKEMVMNHLQSAIFKDGIYSNLNKINLNGIVFKIGSNGLKCLSD